ncbi:hypothetical protein AYK26_02955 [Euryarchaeota archaeon SM23-78]|nr:MAG: hypothetical protein AYK26_02955 [Euryarchaeota archaeon SM23-78]MBW3000402.1 hypothetical protein [Candidatus Woesearchaeota archaeon]
MEALKCYIGTFIQDNKKKYISYITTERYEQKKPEIRQISFDNKDDLISKILALQPVLNYEYVRFINLKDEKTTPTISPVEINEIKSLEEECKDEAKKKGLKIEVLPSFPFEFSKAPSFI